MAGFAERTAKGGKVLVNQPPKKPGRISSHVLRLQSNSMMIHYFLMADDKTDTFYVVSFESPVDEWDANQKYLEPILGQMIWDIAK